MQVAQVCHDILLTYRHVGLVMICFTELLLSCSRNAAGLLLSRSCCELLVKGLPLPQCSG
jgi:hypothetical protein